MKKILISTLIFSGSICGSAIGQNVVENQITEGSAFEVKVARESMNVFPKETGKGIKQGSLEMEKIGTPINNTNGKKVSTVRNFQEGPKKYTPVMNANGAYLSAFVGTPLVANYKEAWEKNSVFDREMDLNFGKPSLSGGIRIGQKFDLLRGEIEASYEQMNFESSETPYQRQISVASGGFNLLVDIGDFILRPYVGAGVGYSQIRTKRTGIYVPLTGEGKDSTSSYYVKPIAGVSFNIPGGNIFGEVSYKIYGNPKFTGIYEDSTSTVANPVFIESDVNYKNFGVFGISGGITFYF